MENEKEALSHTSELLSDSAGEVQKLTAAIALERNQRALLEVVQVWRDIYCFLSVFVLTNFVVQECLIERLEEKTTCCCTEAKALTTTVREHHAAALEKTTAQIKVCFFFKKKKKKKKKKKQQQQQQRKREKERDGHIQVLTSKQETAKLHSVIEQQNRYINDSKVRSNAKIRMLHAQLTQLQEQLRGEH